MIRRAYLLAFVSVLLYVGLAHAHLSQAQRFSITLDIGFDAVQDSGQKIEFGETRQVVLRRPDRLRVDATKRDGAKSTLLFDGKDLMIYYHCGSTWYQPVTQGSQVTYIVVNPPK